MSNNGLTWQQDFIHNAVYRIDESMRMIEISLQNLEEDQLWKKPNNASNSVGNLLIHLGGNIKQYIISSLGGEADTRIRDMEFAISGGQSKDELFEHLRQITARAKEIISNCEREALLRMRVVQGFQLTGIGVVMHVVEHLSYHTGQIAFWTKLLNNKDLSFYEGIDLNIKNEEDNAD